jgi:hypothetical protein
VTFSRVRESLRLPVDGKEEQHRMQSSNENPTFEQIGKAQWDPSGVFRIRYGLGLDDPKPFVLTVTLPYVARELGRSVSFAEISKYVEQNADKKPDIRVARTGSPFASFITREARRRRQFVLLMVGCSYFKFKLNSILIRSGALSLRTTRFSS